MTEETVRAVRTIGSTITAIDQTAAAIAAAVEQQSSASREIARNVQQASTGTRHVTETIALVSSGAGSTGEAAGRLFVTANQLTDRTNELTRDVTDFLSAIREGGDRRRFERIHICLKVSVDGRGVSTEDISEGGACIEGELGFAVGSTVQVAIEDLAPVRGCILECAGGKTRVQFALDVTTQSRLAARIAGWRAAA
jgi:methyl-accepting chemotaxis protein